MVRQAVALERFESLPWHASLYVPRAPDFGRVYLPLSISSVRASLCVRAHAYAGLPRWPPRDADRLLHGCAPCVPLPAGAVTAGTAGLCGECDTSGLSCQLQVTLWGVQRVREWQDESCRQDESCKLTLQSMLPLTSPALCVNVCCCRCCCCCFRPDRWCAARSVVAGRLINGYR